METSTFRLRLLGGMALVGPDGDVAGRAAQRRRVAILALLSFAPGYVLSRDKLMAFLWPEAASEEARHRLSVALYELRRALGERALVTRGDDVVLDPAVVCCDATEFEEAVLAGAADAAVGLYAGPFLDGVHLGEAPGFEEWAAGVRERLERAHCAVLETVARSRAGRGDLAGAADSWRRLARADPYSGHVALELMRALEVSGNRAAALHHATVHATLLRTELGIDPGPDIDGFVRGLRAAPAVAGSDATTGTAAAVVATSTSYPADGSGSASAARTEAAPDEVASLEPGGSIRPAVRRPRRRLRRRIAAVAALVLLGASAGLALFNDYRSTASDIGGSDAHRFVVLPFSVHGDEPGYLGSGMVDLLSAALDGAGDLTPVDPYAVHAFLSGNTAGAAAGDAAGDASWHARAVASRFGARQFVLGSIFGAGGRVRIHAALYDATRHEDAAPLSSAVVEGDVDDALRLVDELAARLIARHTTMPLDATVRLAALTTHSLPALKAYLAGESHFRSGRFIPAADSFRVAAERDTTFALAHYRHALAVLWADREGVSAGDAEERALRHAGRLGRREQLLLHAFAAWRTGDADQAETLYRQILAAYPDDVEAWFQLGETLFHYNPLRGRPAAEAAVAFERVLRFDPAHRGAAWHLALLAAQRHEVSELRRLTDMLTAGAQNQDAYGEARVLSALSERAGAALDGMAKELSALTPLRRSTLAWRTAVFLGQPAEAARILEHNAAGTLRYWRTLALLDQADIEHAAGRRRSAQSIVTELMTSYGVAELIIERRALPLATPAFAAGADELRAAEADVGELLQRIMRSTPTATQASAPSQEAYLTGLIRAALGDTSAVRERVLRLEELAITSPAGAHALTFAATLRAHLARAAGDPAAALRELESNPVRRWYGHALTSPLQAMTHERFLRAELLSELGREREALAWYYTFGEHGLHDLVYLPAAHLRSAEIHERLGEAEEAARHYGRVLELWRNADSDLMPLVANVRQRWLRLAGSEATVARR